MGDIFKEKDFHGYYKGKSISLYTLSNKNGIIIQFTNFGGKIVSIFTPDRKGNFDDIVLGYCSPNGYIKGNPYFGSICGRYANRIGNSRFTFDKQEYLLSCNDHPNSLHGGTDGFNNQMFDVLNTRKNNYYQSILMAYTSEDGEMGYPGTLALKVCYTLTDKNEFCLDFEATTDKPTHINICSHPFFNLCGEGNSDILGHELIINAENYIPLNEMLIPTGEIMPVIDTPMDFTKPFIIGERINEKYEQLLIGRGYNHNWVLKKKPGELSFAASCCDPVSGRVLEVFTTQPGLQFYTGDWLDGSDIGKKGIAYDKNSALCLETQHFPDSPNKATFPSTLLTPGETYKHSCIYKFSIQSV